MLNYFVLKFTQPLPTLESTRSNILVGKMLPFLIGQDFSRHYHTQRSLAETLTCFLLIG